MASGRKRQGRTDRQTAPPARETPDAPSPSPSETPPVARPPRRNVPLLIASIVLLAAWTAVMVWLAAFA